MPPRARALTGGSSKEYENRGVRSLSSVDVEILDRFGVEEDGTRAGPDDYDGLSRRKGCKDAGELRFPGRSRRVQCESLGLSDTARRYGARAASRRVNQHGTISHEMRIAERTLPGNGIGFRRRN